MHALLAWAREVGGLVVEDDYDAEFRYDRSPVGALQGLGPDVVVYGGSASKTLAPGLRLGWLVVPEHLLPAFTDAKYAADLGRGVLDQATLAELLASGEMDRHIRRMASTYRRRRDRLAGAVATHLPGWETTGSAAGLHVVLRPPSGDEDALAALAQRCGLDARPLGPYAITAQGQPGLVVGFGHQRAGLLGRGGRLVRRGRRGHRPLNSLVDPGPGVCWPDAVARPEEPEVRQAFVSSQEAVAHREDRTLANVEPGGAGARRRR